MEKRDLKISIGHIYPKQLNANGDIGNIVTLIKRSEWRGIEVKYKEINLEDLIPECDLYFIGGSQGVEQLSVSSRFYEHKAFLHEQMNLGSVFLGISAGYQLLGNYYQPLNGDKVLGIGLLDVCTKETGKRFTGNVTAKTDFLTPNTLVGFENHSGVTYIQGETRPLATVEIGKGNNAEDKTEGARFKNVFGSYLIGPLLPKNPHFADYLISLALEKRYGEKIDLPKLDDKIETDAHVSVIGKVY